MKTSLPLKPTILNSPLYRGGNSTRMVQEKYGLTEVYKLASNENPLPTTPSVVAAVSAAAAELNRYPSMGDETLREALAAYIGRGTTAANFVTGNGGCDVLFMLANGFLSPGDEAIICPPTFPVYEWSVRRVGATLVKAPLTADFAYDVETILAAVTERTRLIYLCSPNNPTGGILPQAALDQLLAHLPEHVVVISDEVYNQFNTAADYANSYRPLHAGRNLIIVHSFSKVFGLAGLRLGYAIAPPALAEYIGRMRLPFHLSHLSMAAGMAALAERDYVEKSVELIVGERRRIYDALRQRPFVTVYPSEANFLLFKPAQDSKEMAEQLQQRGVIVRDLHGFYLPGYLRVSIGQPQENDCFLAALDAVQEHMASAA